MWVDRFLKKKRHVKDPVGPKKHLLEIDVVVVVIVVIACNSNGSVVVFCFTFHSFRSFVRSFVYFLLNL